MNLVNALRERFPHPITHAAFMNAPAPDAYCVGGALCLHAQGLRGWRFPSEPALARTMMDYNEALSYETALNYAECITRENDDGNFESAWTYLASALAHGKENAE